MEYWNNNDVKKKLQHCHQETGTFSPGSYITLTSLVGIIGSIDNTSILTKPCYDALVNFHLNVMKKPPRNKRPRQTGIATGLIDYHGNNVHLKVFATSDPGHSNVALSLHSGRHLHKLTQQKSSKIKSWNTYSKNNG